MKIVIGTRGSKLALAQTHYIEGLLREIGVDVEVKIVKTTGDKVQDKKLSELGIGVFTKELDLKMLNNEVDIAVHSLKDVPTVWNENLTISATPPRESYHDLILWKKENEFDIEHDELIVGTSSIRRTEFLSIKYPNLKIKLLRGNVDTRLRKLKEGQYDAIIIAEAGLRRLKIDLSEFNYMKLDILPAPAQGVIGVASRKDDKEINEILQKINDKKTYLEATAERWALREYGGGCQAPFGALANYDEENEILNLRCELAKEENQTKSEGFCNSSLRSDRQKVVISKEGFVYCSVDKIDFAKKIGEEVGKALKHVDE